MAEKDSTTKHSPVPIHKKSEEQVSTAGATSSARIEQVEHGSAEKGGAESAPGNPESGFRSSGAIPDGHK
ncbi:hypothetical protein PABG_12410 [Paracoccidioides brasiliensis Pb03]|nr:hypothetical protein PABG_12410 [Paracoccidioides brasiliensis Pb03]